MAEGAIASAVALPDPEITSPDTAQKRRQSPSREESDHKRRRVSTSQERGSQNQTSASPPTEEKNTTNESAADKSSRRQSRPDEERKRGKRLFGALLGTLSQSSVTAAQKRRADIDRKQQAKLKQQEEEYDEEYRKRCDNIKAQREKEQRIYERESLHVRHSNMRAAANFLKTKTQPTLYYKPYQLRPEDRDIINAQTDTVETTIAKETDEFELRNPPETDEPKHNETESAAMPPNVEATHDGTTVEPFTNVDQKPITVGSDTNEHENLEKEKFTANNTSIPPDDSERTNPKPSEDDSGEVVVEDKEDTVIY